MESNGDLHVEYARLQDEIEQHLGMKGIRLIFEYRNLDSGKVALDLITVNPRHDQSFLFHTEKGTDKRGVLRQMLDYVRNYKEKESSYTIQWVIRGQQDLHTSYFRASNVMDALDKLYYGRDQNTITVFSVVLNPVS